MIKVKVSGKKIQVGSLHYLVQATEEARKDCVANSRYGSCSFVRQRIFLDPSNAEERQNETFIHECLEAVNDHMQTKMPHSNITRIASGLSQVMESLGLRFVTK